MRGKNLTAKSHQSDAFTISGFEPRSTLAFKAYSAADAACRIRSWVHDAGTKPSLARPATRSHQRPESKELQSSSVAVSRQHQKLTAECQLFSELNSRSRPICDVCSFELVTPKRSIESGRNLNEAYSAGCKVVRPHTHLRTLPL